MALGLVALACALVSLAAASAPALADGQGTMSVSPSYVRSGSTNVELTFTFTAGEEMPNGVLTLTVPTGWPAPTLDNAFNDCAVGSNSVNGMTYTMNEVDLSSGDQCQVFLGFSTGLTAPTTTGPYTFTTAEQANASSGSLTNIPTSPVVAVGNDGTGTLTVSPTHVVAGTSGNTLTFTYTAAQTMTAGKLTVAIPADWSAPAAGGSSPGATVTNCPGGSVGISGTTITVSGVNLASSGSSCTITYGDTGSGGPGASSPSAGSEETFTATQEAASSDNNQFALVQSPFVEALAADGSGTMTVSPNQVATSSMHTYAFTYTAAALTDEGSLTITFPSGWSAPNTSGGAGFMSDSCDVDGSSVVGRTYTSLGVYLNQGQSCTITYTSAVAPATGGSNSFPVQEKSSSTGTLTTLAASPTVAVGSDGLGTLTVSPTQVTAGSPSQLTFTYTAGTTVTAGELTIAVPSGWSAPTVGGSGPGATTTTCGGTVSIGASNTIQVNGFSLANGSPCTVTYGSTASGGTGAVSPSDGGLDGFNAEEKSSSDGTLIALGSSPSVSAVAPDGSGTATVSPSPVTPGSSHSFTFVYTAAAYMPDGELTLTAPAGWPTPQTTNSGAAGYTVDDCAINGTAISGATYESLGDDLIHGDKCEIQYNNVTVPGSSGTFVMQQKSTTGGTLTSIASSPVIVVGADGLGSMTVSPTQATAGTSGNTLTFTYTAAAAISDGAITIAVPADWSPPSTSASAAGAISTSCAGTLGAANGTIEVSGLSLGNGSSCTVVYGDQTSGPGASAPTSGGTETFTTEEQGSSTGTLTALSASPTETVVAVDGAGSMAVSPTNTLNGGSQLLTFTYGPVAGSLSDGKLSITIPADWATPQTGNSSGAGFVFDGCGSALSISGMTLTSSGVDLGSNQTCEITYQAVAPATSGSYTFVTEEASSATGTLTTLGSSPSVAVNSDGVGTLSVAPSAVSAGSSGNTVTFTYRSPAAVALSGGELTIATPSGWSPPSTSASAAGYTTSTCGTVSTSATSIDVTGIDLGAALSCTVTYGDTSSSGPGVSIGAATGEVTFDAQERSGATGTLTALSSSPNLSVFAPDGSGTMTVSPAFTTPGASGVTLSFTYTAADGGVSGGRIEIAPPDGWPAPSTTPGAAGYTTASCGSVAVSNGAIEVSGVSAIGGGTCTITYGNTSSGGAGASAPSTPGPSAFATQEASTALSPLTAIASSPTVSITSPDGSGTMTVGPTGAQSGSGGNTLTFSYTAATGGIESGELTLAVPAGWSAPSTTTTDAGYTTSSCGTVAVSGTTVQITGVTLAGAGSCTVVYGSTAGGGSGASAPSTDGANAFTAQEKSTGSGTLTSLGSSPSVTTTKFPTLTVTVSGAGTVSGGSISCPGTCSQTAAPGTVVALTAHPASGFSFSGWSGACTGTGACSVTLSDDTTVTATFAKNPTLTVTVSGSGTVSGASISCPGTCSQTSAPGTGVGLTAHPASGFSFAGWSGACSGTGACSVTLSSDKTVTATFKKNTPPPSGVKCTVPKLKGDSLSRAESLLKKAHCAVGKISKPKVKHGHKQPKLVVGSTKPRAGSKLPKGSKVAITLVAAPKRHKH
jgi:hypothetical protein